MLRIKRHTTTALLLVFVLGGFGGPLLHRLQHALENGAAQGAVHDHAHPEDGTATLTKVAAGELAPLDCVLCASIVYQVGLDLAHSSTLPVVAGIAPEQLFEHTSLIKSPDRARAPPAVS